jgi:opacity protein-like surface antigen
MFAKRFSLVALLAFMTLLQAAVAQDNQVSGLIGRTFISDQGIPGANFTNPIVHFGNGLTFEANYSRHVLGSGFSRLWLEIPAEFNLDEDLATGANVIPNSYKSIFIAPSARVNFFSMTAISPWVSIGGGVGLFRENSTLLYGGKNPGSTSTTTGALQAGAGLDVRFHPKWSVRGEVRDFWTGVPDLNVKTTNTRQHNFFVGGGIVYHFGK